jgi:hypothetical protein
MRRLLLALVLGLGLADTECGWAQVQPTQPPMPPPAADKAPEVPRVNEPLKRPEGSSTVVNYTLAAIATIIVMVLVCMPARRE